MCSLTSCCSQTLFTNGVIHAYDPNTDMWFNSYLYLLFFFCLLDNKPFAAQSHVKPTSPPPEEVKQNETQTTVKSERDSPAPTSYEDLEKKSQTIKQKGRPRPLPGSKPEIKCEQCGKIFGSSSALAKHKLTHSDERRYVCPICSKGFKRQDHL